MATKSLIFSFITQTFTLMAVANPQGVSFEGHAPAPAFGRRRVHSEE